MENLDYRFEYVVKEQSSEALLEMVYQFNDWDPLMLLAAENELKERQLLPDEIAARRQAIIANENRSLEHGREASAAGLAIGWICIIGVLGMIIGYHYAFSKTINPYSGEKFYVYDKASRENGRYMFSISLAITIIFVLYKTLAWLGHPL